MNKMTSRKQQAFETKLRITSCALELYKEKSSTEIKVSDICDAANVSIGAFYHHFNSKDDIISTAYASLDALIVDAVDEKHYDSDFDKILAVYEETGRIVGAYGYNFVAQAYKTMLDNHDGATFSKERTTYLLIAESIQNLMDKDELNSSFTSLEIADYLMRIGRGLLFDWCLQLGSYDITAVMKDEVTFALRNLNLRIQNQTNL